jgi:hypothetical protein
MRNLAAAHLRDNAPRNGEIRGPVESSTAERKRFDLDSRTIVDHPGFHPTRRPPVFKSRQAESPFKSQQEKHLPATTPSLAGQL